MYSGTNPYTSSNFPNFLISFPTISTPASVTVFPLTSRSICLIQINRPQKYNSWTKSMFSEYARLWEVIEKDEEVRVVILAGSGEHLSAGIDVAGLAETMTITSTGGNDESQHEEGRYYGKVQDLRKDIREMQKRLVGGEKSSKPFIALLHGICYGLALELTSTADIRLATSTAKMSIKEIDVGITADLGVLSRLPKITGNMSLVKTLAFTGREFDGREALEFGFVSEVVEGGVEEGLKRAVELAGWIAGKSTRALEGVKAVLNHQMGRTVEESLEYTAVWNAPGLLSGDAKKVIEEFTKNAAKKRKSKM